MAASALPIQAALRKLVGKRTLPPWKPLPPPATMGARPPEVGKGVPKGGDTGTLE